MGIKSFLSRPYAKWIAGSISKDIQNPIYAQNKVFKNILKQAAKTEFGKFYGLKENTSYADFRLQVQVNDYEGFKPWIERITKGENNVLWTGLPIYFAKTSGSTSGVKYIPITKDSIHNHIDTARNALLNYIHVTGNSTFADHQMIFLQGSPVLMSHGAVNSGRLSGIVAHHVPKYLQNNRLPSWQTNCIEDWETKVDKIVDETIGQRMSVISGIPSWLRMYFEKLVEKSGKTVGELFPDFQVLVYGGVNYEPYRSVFNQLIGRPVDTVELFPASEGFFAYQDEFPGDDLLLNVNSGIFYEFIPVSDFLNNNQNRIPLEGVKCGIDYALIITSNAGLYAYSIGDTVRFTNTKPYRIKISGRISQYISAFGEHVIASEIESAMAEANQICDVQVREFTVSPMINPSQGKAKHEWLIEFEKVPESMEKYGFALDEAMCKRNIYYKDLIEGHVLDRLQIVALKEGAFELYMKQIGKLGGQNKVPRLANDRTIATVLLELNR